MSHAASVSRARIRVADVGRKEVEEMATCDRGNVFNKRQKEERQPMSSR